MHQVFTVLKSINDKMTSMAGNLDTNGWIMISAVCVVGGWLLLKGDALKAN